MATDRKDRVEETRKCSSRDAEIRKLLTMTYIDKLDTGSYPKPDDVDYFWARKSFRGELDHDRIPYLRRKGWERVPADRHPDLVDEESRKTYIEKEGLVLMQRPKEYGEIERATQQQIQHQTMTSLPGLDNFMNEPTMPIKVFENKTYMAPEK